MKKHPLKRKDSSPQTCYSTNYRPRPTIGKTHHAKPKPGVLVSMSQQNKRTGHANGVNGTLIAVGSKKN